MDSVGGIAVAKINDLPPSDFYLIGAKPQHFPDLTKTFSPATEATLISLMAGVSIDSLKRGFHTDKIIRLMPNTPCLIGEGVVGLMASKEVKNLPLVLDLLKNVGLVEVVNDEELINIITAFTGSGPAYVFEFANILGNLMSEMGFEKEVAQKLIEQMIFGAATLMKSCDESPFELRDNVTSKGGTTEAALNIFKAEGLENMIKSAIDANLTRARALEGENK